jgi:hypothetical protein
MSIRVPAEALGAAAFSDAGTSHPWGPHAIADEVLLSIAALLFRCQRRKADCVTPRCVCRGIALVFAAQAPNVFSVAEPDQHKERRHGIPPQIDG